MKTILITGSTDGIGKLTALKLAKEGHEILVHGRNPEKLKQTVTDLKTNTGNNKIEGFLADLTDFYAMKKMTGDIIRSYQKIDVLINNAGVYSDGAQKNQSNLDRRFVVNYLAPIILTRGLKDLLDNADEPRVLNLSSAAQAAPRSLSLEALKGNQNLSEYEGYGQSKLALTMWSFHFAAKHPEITTIAVNPGSLLNTKMVHEAFGHYRSPADKGADILIELALDGNHKKNSGKYFDNDQGTFNRAHAEAYDHKKMASLISETEKIIRNHTS